MDSLQQVGGSGDSADVLKDRHNIYFQGHWLGSAQGYSILGVKSSGPTNYFIFPQ